jgi:hypothetical protein
LIAGGLPGDVPWEATTATDRLREWERDDGHATVRLRRRETGDWAVRLDRLVQAPEGSAYRFETVADADEAATLAARWRDEFDRPAADG